MKTRIPAIICIALTVFTASGCGSMSNLAKGGLIGTGAGAAVGAGVGALLGKSAKSTAIGAAIGTAVGATAGTIIGNEMDKKAKELAAIDGAKVETVTDANNLNAVKVTFDSGILFATNSSTLTAASKAALRKFATTMTDMTETDITIQGHTDNTGTHELNEKLSLKRAQAVSDYLKSCGMASDRFKVEGLAYDSPVASNDTAEGRAQNRRVEVYITANETMIKQAEASATK